MPEVEIILSLKPANLNFLKFVDYPVRYFEKFAQRKQIQMQFEITIEGILAFFKTRADLDKILHILNQVSLESNPTFSPSISKRAWEFTVIKPEKEGQNLLLQLIAEKSTTFVGHFGRVERSDGKVAVYFPENFHLDTYFSSVHLPRKTEKPFNQQANQ